MGELRVGTAFDAHRLVPGRRSCSGASRSRIRSASRATPMPTSSVTRSATPCSARPAWTTSARCSPRGTSSGAGARSLDLLAEAWTRIAGTGWGLVNVDAFVVLQAPRLAPYRTAMRESVAGALGCDLDRVSIRATGTDGLGFTGRGEGAACQAVALLAVPELLQELAEREDDPPSASIVASAMMPSTWIGRRCRRRSSGSRCRRTRRAPCRAPSRR